MKRIITSLILCLSMLISSHAEAHNPLIATYALRLENNQWQLLLLTPLYGLHASLLERHEESVLLNKDGKYNQEVAFEYLIKNIHIYDESQKLDLTPQSAQINDHQSIFYFSVKGITPQTSSLILHIPALSKNVGQTNIFRYSKGEDKRKAVLNIRNDYKGSISIQ